MNKFTLLALTLLTCAVPCLAAPGDEFNIKNVAIDTSTTSPDFQAGGQPAIRWTAQKWLKIETTFDAVPEFTDELTFTYYVLFADRLFVGRVNHVNIAKGVGLHSAMYMSPKAIQRIMQKKLQAQINMAALPITQITVTISKPGVIAPLAMANLKPGGVGEWWATMKQEEGYLLNKSETPFAPLYWDYYEAVKSAAGR